ncbi:MAG: L-aspartate oxidase [Elusimicrobia bacterium HGW-Elusimicrobia-2]|nr:MAG: L-aspartate oxidase [Elusimicrobia bacterium HGW-Elusimicrobia-2]
MVYDVLIIGSGLAGLFAALKQPRDLKVALVTKRDLADSETVFAQGGISCVTSGDDSFDMHINDTLKTGGGLSNKKIADIVVGEMPARLKELEGYGVKFNKISGKYDLHLEGGHSRRRVVHADDHTGKTVEDALVSRVRRAGNIEIFENHIAVNLIIKDSSCWGAYVLDESDLRITAFKSRATLLAAGGAGKSYLYTSNPDVSTGDGVAMAYRAGCRILNMEFVQFHPTCLFHPEAKSFLISEAVRGEGGRLFTRQGKRFMKDYHPKMELAPRDIVARAIDDVLKKSGEEFVYLDISYKGAAFVRKKFPYLSSSVKKYGFDMGKAPIPVVPAAHYMCGGIAVDENAATDIKNLFAAGENACTGLHGANRLASNSLAEAMVFAHRAAASLASVAGMKKKIPKIALWKTYGARPSDEAVVISQNWDEIRRFMWNYVGIVRSMKRLVRARNRIKNILEEIEDYYWNFLVTRDLIELRNIAQVADITIESALSRKESRGTHYMIDYPGASDPAFRKDSVVKKIRGKVSVL